MSQYGGGPNEEESDHEPGPTVSGETVGSARTVRQSDTGVSFLRVTGMGAVMGVAAYVLNFVLMGVYLAIDGVEFGDDAVALIGNVLYNAQFVSTEFTATETGQTLTLNFVTGSSSNQLMAAFLTSVDVTQTIPAFVYHATPMAVLFLLGVGLVQWVPTRPTPFAGAVLGAFVTVGTVVLSVVGVFVFEHTSGDIATVTLAPELGIGVMLVGIAFPVVFGGLGGLVGAALKT